MREKVSIQNANSLKFSARLKGDNIYNDNSTFSSLNYTFSWQETYFFTRQIKVQIRKSTFIILVIKEKRPTLAGIKHFSVLFFLHEPRHLHLSTEKVGVRTVGNGHQSGYSRAHTINININKRWQKNLEEENKKIHWEKYFRVQKRKFTNAKRFNVYMLHRLNPLLGTKLGFFLAPSTFLLAHASLWPERSGRTT